jgi:hypothetical protein
MAGIVSLATDVLAWGPPRRKRDGTTAWLSLLLRDGTLNVPHNLPGPLGSNKLVKHCRVSAKKRSSPAATGLKGCLKYPSSFELLHLTGHPLPPSRRDACRAGRVASRSEARPARSGQQRVALQAAPPSS